MAIRFRRVQRMADPRTPDVKKFYPVISYKFDTPVTLREVAAELSVKSGMSEGATLSVLKDFRAMLRKTLLSGRSLNLDGLGYFFLSAKSDGQEVADDLTANDIKGLRVCFRANKDIRLTARGSTRTVGLTFKDLDRLGVVDEEDPMEEQDPTVDPDASDQPGGSSSKDPASEEKHEPSGQDPAEQDGSETVDPGTPDTGREEGGEVTDDTARD